MLTVATKETEGFRRFKRSAQFFNYKIQVRESLRGAETAEGRAQELGSCPSQTDLGPQGKLLEKQNGKNTGEVGGRWKGRLEGYVSVCKTRLGEFPL